MAISMISISTVISMPMSWRARSSAVVPSSSPSQLGEGQRSG
jgi:hypothetical protein